MKRKHAPRSLTVAALVFIAISALGCGSSTPAAQSPGDKAASFKTAAIEKKTLRPLLEQPGHLLALEETPLHSRLSGYVGKVHADIGDSVKVGQILAEIQVPEMEEELKLKQAL